MEDKKSTLAFYVDDLLVRNLWETLDVEVEEHKFEILFDVYLVKNGQHEKLITKGDLVTPAFINMLKQNHQNTYIPLEQKELLRDYMKEHVLDVLKGSYATKEEKSKILYDNTTTVIKDLFDQPITPKSIGTAKEAVNSVIDTVLNGNVTLEALLNVTSYDYYTYTHSVDVAVYSIVLAKKLNLSEETIRIIGESAILHDIGKTKIPSDIVNKNGKLTVEEFEIIKHHPTYGYEILLANGEKDKNILSGVLEHHEKIDGTGYPNKLKGSQISPIAMIISCADIFDALTTKRSYKDPFSSYDALSIMEKQMLGGLNKKILREFVLLMGNGLIK